jgi:hypothetical protein
MRAVVCGHFHALRAEKGKNSARFTPTFRAKPALFLPIQENICPILRSAFFLPLPLFGDVRDDITEIAIKLIADARQKLKRNRLVLIHSRQRIGRDARKTAQLCPRYLFID